MAPEGQPSRTTDDSQLRFIHQELETEIFEDTSLGIPVGERGALDFFSSPKNVCE